MTSYTKGDKVEYLNRETDRWEPAVVTGTGEYRDQIVIDVKLENGDEKFGYAYQVRAA